MVRTDPVANSGAHGKGEPSKVLCDRLLPDSRILVLGSSRRITIMRFRPANIRLINRRRSFLDRRLVLSLPKHAFPSSLESLRAVLAVKGSLTPRNPSAPLTAAGVLRIFCPRREKLQSGKPKATPTSHQRLCNLVLDRSLHIRTFLAHSPDSAPTARASRATSSTKCRLSHLSWI